MDCTLVRISLIGTHCSLCVDSMCLLKFDVDEPVALLCSSQYLHFAFFVLVFLSNSISSYEWLRINGRRAPLFAIIYLFFLFPPVQLSPALLVISYVNLLGLLSKPRIYLKDRCQYWNTGLRVWRVGFLLVLCNRHRNTKRVLYSYFIMSSWEFPYAPPGLKKMHCNREMESILGLFLVNNGFRFTWDSFRLG